jgi:large subunit ribosomal protein L5
MTRLQDKYKNEISAGLKDKFEYKNIHQIPRLDKIVVSMGVGKAVENKSAIDSAVKDMAKITGQKPVVRTAKGSISNFRLREGSPVGCMTTLRNERMYEFMDRLVSVVLPRIRDFRGVKANFDGRGNFSLGLNEQTLFPEIQLDQVEFTQGMNITFVTSARTDEEGRALLDGFGVPFRRNSSEN